MGGMGRMVAAGARVEVAATRTGVAVGAHTAAVGFTAADLVEATSTEAACIAAPAAADTLAAVVGIAAFPAGSVSCVEAAADPIEDPDREDSARFLPAPLANPPIPDMSAAAGRVPIAPPWDA
jgi:hypothetical protein